MQAQERLFLVLLSKTDGEFSKYSGSQVFPEEEQAAHYAQWWVKREPALRRAYIYEAAVLHNGNPTRTFGACAEE